MIVLFDSVRALDSLAQGRSICATKHRRGHMNAMMERLCSSFERYSCSMYMTFLLFAIPTSSKAEIICLELLRAPHLGSARLQLK